MISELDKKKNKAVRNAYEQVNKDFGSIFSTLLPGARVKLQTLEGQPVTEGLEVKVGHIMDVHDTVLFKFASLI